MDYIAGSFYDGFVLYAMALDETLAEGGAQNNGINITRRTQNRSFWGELTSVNCTRNLLTVAGNDAAFYRSMRPHTNCGADNQRCAPVLFHCKSVEAFWITGADLCGGHAAKQHQTQTAFKRTLSPQ